MKVRHPFKNSRDILLARICLGSSGFTVIELLVLMTILAILAALLLPPLRDTLANRQARAQARAEMALISEALERYRAYYGDYPLIDDDPEAFFSALHGRRGPKSTIDAGSARRFINAASFTLRHPFRNDSADANALIDPWGEPYFYTYKNSEGDGAEWVPYGFILISAGPDGRRGVLPDDGQVDAHYFTVSTGRDDLVHGGWNAD